MKRTFLLTLSFALFAGAADAYLYTSSKAGGKWSNISSWARSSGDLGTVEVPNGNTAMANLMYNFETIDVDGDYTLSYMSMNRDLGASWEGKGLGDIARPTINLKGTKSDSTDGSLTFDLANNTHGTFLFASGTGTNVTGGNAYVSNDKKFHTYDWKFSISGGSVNITDTANIGTRTAIIDIGGEETPDWTGYTRAFDFSTALNSTEDLKVVGWKYSKNTTGVFKIDFNKSLTLKNGATYKSLTLADTASDTGLIATIGTGATADIGSLTMGKKTILNIDGTAVINAKSTTAANSKITVNGSLTYSGSFTMAGEMVVNGKLKSVSSDPYFRMLAGSKLTINSKNAGDVSLGVGLRMDGGKVVVNGNAFSTSQRVWSLSAGNEIELNSNLSFYAFCWITGSTMKLTFADGILLTLNTLSTNNGDYWSRALDSNVGLELINYSNGQIQVTRLTDNSWTDPDRTKNATDDLSVIVADGFEKGSFEWIWHEETKTYWLTGNAIVPEPSTCAAVLGVLALAFAVSRRRR